MSAAMAETNERRAPSERPAGEAELRGAIRNVRRAAVLAVVVLVVSTLGYMVLEGWGFLDALYMTVITVGTVGYGEEPDLSSDATQRVWNMVVIFGGIGAVGYAVSSVVGLVVEGTVGGYFQRRRMEARIDELRGHYVLCGYGRVGRMIADELAEEEGARFVVVDRDEGNVERCVGDGYLALLGDASDDDVLEAAGVRRAKGLVAAVASDAVNMFVVVSARGMNPDLHIVARVESEESAPKLEKAGADRTLSPYEVGGRRLAHLTVHPAIVDYLDIVTRGEEGIRFRLEEFEVGDDSPLVGHTFRQMRAAEEETGARVLAVRHGDNTFNTNPSAEDEVLAGDTLIVLGTRDQVARLERLVED